MAWRSLARIIRPGQLDQQSEEHTHLGEWVSRWHTLVGGKMALKDYKDFMGLKTVKQLNAMKDGCPELCKLRGI